VLYYNLEEQEEDYACRPLKGAPLGFEKKLDRYPIIMVDRGNCSFVTKARNVQYSDGHLALIINNEPGPVTDILMNDDGSSNDIIIPAILISQEDGNKLKAFLKENKNNQSVLENVIISVEFIIVIFDLI
jgi:hypothetical protein